MASVLLKHEVVITNDSLVIGAPMKLGYIDGNLIILDYKSESFFHWIKLPECKYMGAFGVRGQGPDEFLNIKSLHLICDTLYAYDFYKSELVQVIPTGEKLDFKKVLNLPKSWIMDLLPLSKEIYCSTGCFEEGIFHLVDSTGNMLYVSDNYPARDKAEAQLSNQVRYMAYQGCMETDGNGHIVYLTSQSKQRYIYKLEHDSLIELASYLDSYPQYTSGGGDGFSVIHDVNAPVGYRDVIADDDVFYALYSGRSFKDFQLKSFECPILYAYNWQGELLKTYELDVPITNVCLDKEHHVFYGIANLPDPVLVRFKI
ncbi:BF3164 family lipoprotein [Phocaeicola sp.]